MKLIQQILLIVIIYTLSNYSLKAQREPFTQTPFKGGIAACDCAVVLSNAGIKSGNLDEFEADCDKTVLSTTHIGVSNLANSMFDVMELYATSRHPICLSGRFSFENPIKIPRGTNINLLPGTVITYNGIGPGFEFEGSHGALQGTSEGNLPVIISSQPMEDGLIRIYSEDSAHPIQENIGVDNNFFNQIKNLKLVSTAKISDDPKGNRAIVLVNHIDAIVQKITSSDDIGANYHATISNVSINGFSLGINLRGESNANNIKDISMRNISGYGLWVSGCTDNSISNISFENCPTATAVRIDNYVRDIYQEGIEVIDGSGIYLGGTGITNGPNLRVPVSTNDILTPLISGSIDQGDFNDNLNNLNPALISILQASGCNTLDNILASSNIMQFGLRGYANDGELNEYNYPNLEGDSRNITQVDSDPNCNGSGACIYGSILDETGNFLNPTCGVQTFHTSYYQRPRFNVVTRLNVFDANGELQVAKAAQFADSELNNFKCERKDLSLLPIVCEDPCDTGIQNKVYLCSPSTSINTNLSDLVDLGFLSHNCQSAPASIINAGQVKIFNGFEKPAFNITYLP